MFTSQKAFTGTKQSGLPGNHQKNSLKKVFGNKVLTFGNKKSSGKKSP